MIASYPGATVQWELWIAGEETYSQLLQIKKWNLSFKRALEPIEWDAELIIPSGNYSPSGVMQRLLEGEGYNAEFVPQVWLHLRIQIAGKAAWVSPPLFVLDTDGELDANRSSIAISGHCPIEMLLTDDQAMASVKSEVGDVYTAQGIVSQTFGQFGISLLTQHYTNWTVPELDRIGEPLGWVREVTQLVAAWGHWVGNTYHIRPGGVDIANATADYSLGEGDLLSLRWRRSVSGLKNQATVERVGQPTSGLNAPAKGQTPPYVVKVTLDNPVTYGTAVVDLGGPAGDSNWVWYDESDNVLTPSPQKTYLGITPAHAVQFTITPEASYESVPISWVLNVPGTVHNSDLLGDWEDDYSATHTDSVSPGLHGIRPYAQPFVFRTCPNQAIAALAAQTIVREGMRMWTTASVEMLLDTDYRCGLILSLTIPRIGWTAKKFQIESMRWSGDANKLDMGLELARNAA